MMTGAMEEWAFRAGRYARTIRHMRCSQLVRQIHHRVVRRALGGRLPATPAAIPLRAWQQAWAGPSYLPRREVEPALFRFLNQSGHVVDSADWNACNRSRLWLYNLHYLDDLAISDSTLTACQSSLLERWIANNPPLTGAGWEPYPLSLRLVNAVKWCSRQADIPLLWRQSLFGQASALAGQLEWHVLGNHLLANAKALVFCGAFFSGRSGNAWLNTGARLLREQLREQFLPDGGHFERSPMYHAILLWDLCDLCHLLECTALPALQSLAPILEVTLAHGLRWLEKMSAADGLTSFFNDSTLGVAPSFAEVRSYATAVGCPARQEAERGLGLTHLRDSGFAILHLGNGTKAIVDVGSVGPAYQPGHAHAETLALEAGIRGHRVIVNCGVSTYADGPERAFQRSTAAHSTVEIAGRDSSETWASFRVGRRARILDVKTQENADSVMVTAAHDGYRHLSGRPIHRRTVRGSLQSLEITDDVEGGAWPAVARFHLHPDVRPTASHSLILPDNTCVRWSSSTTDARVVASQWHPEFGLSIPTHCIEMPLTRGRGAFTLRW
jgi:uncharacterized heparinase superfamily protein